MIPGLDPKKVAAMMKQMGIKQEEIPANRVIIEQDNGKIIINNPSVLKVNMQGNVNFQISGDIDEQKDAEESSEEKIKEDIKTIVEQTGVSEEVAAIELEKNEGDIAATIINLSK
jgi:alpha-NAC-related protein